MASYDWIILGPLLSGLFWICLTHTEGYELIPNCFVRTVLSYVFLHWGM